MHVVSLTASELLVPARLQQSVDFLKCVLVNHDAGR